MDHKQRRKILTLAAMSLGYGVVQLDVTIVNTALNSMGSSFGGGVAALQWVVNAYTIAFAAFILTAGAAGDRLGAKRVFMAGFAVFTAASLLCAVAPNLILLVIARGLQGLGAALLVPNSLALLNHTYTDTAERGRAVGLWAGGASLALTAGPLVGGILISLTGWRAIFLVNIPIGLLGLLVASVYARDTARIEHRELDLRGQLTSILCLGLLAALIIRSGNVGWGHPLVLGGLALAVLLGVLFVAQERRAAQPMLPLGLFHARAFSLSSLIGLAVNVAFYGLIFVLSLYFQQLNHWSPFETGLAFVPMMGVVLPANLLAPRLSERIGACAVISIGALIAAAGTLSLLFVTRGTSYWAMCPQLLALGGGLGLLVPPMTSMLLGSVAKTSSGVAAGVLNSARQTGSVLGVALFGALVAGGHFVAGMRESLVVAGALLLLSAVLGLLGHGARVTASTNPGSLSPTSRTPWSRSPARTPGWGNDA
ncbi:MAG: MFS transporter [Sinobacteraceae bacterium]|nr:MFS transporter [Nevskiaceae bacterium]